MRLRVGTSGFSYAGWKGHFYPEKLKNAEMLAYYATRLDTVEINNTFYRMPKRELLEGWAAKVGEDFSFVLKASQRITHRRRLADCGEEMGYLAEVSSVLGERRGPMLFQLPPHFKKDVETLTGFLELIPTDVQAAFEFRNASWFDDEVYEALRAGGAALVVSDTGKIEGGPPVVPTAGFGYLRLRQESYDDAALADWAKRVAEQPWGSAHVFFKHEDEGAGPKMAERFREVFEESTC
jgi:uncharacterized protein YecE (DUF72 family)